MKSASSSTTRFVIFAASSYQRVGKVVVFGFSTAGALSLLQKMMWNMRDQADTRLDGDGKRDQPFIVLMNLVGPIVPKEDNFSKHCITAEGFRKDMLCVWNLARKDEQKIEKLVLLVNSPGGSPVQSAQIARQIRMFRKAFPHIKVVAYVADICASGGYFIASQCDEIVCDESSLIGNVGVISMKLGYHGLLQKAGIESRTMAAGKNKVMGNPFEERRQRDVDFEQHLLDALHTTFKKTVIEGRGDKLKRTRAKEKMRQIFGELEEGVDGLLDGTIYAGAEAVEVGLADRIGYWGEDFKDRRIITATHSKTPWILQKLGFTSSFFPPFFMSPAEILQQQPAMIQHGVSPPSNHFENINTPSIPPSVAFTS